MSFMICLYVREAKSLTLSKTPNFSYLFSLDM